MSSETNLQLFPGVFRSTQGGANPDFFLHSSGRVGIGNDAPEVSTVANGNTRFKLNVSGHTHIDGNLDVTGSVYGDGSNMTGVTLPWAQSTPDVGTDIKYEGGNVGIGGVASTERLKVHGTVEASSFSGILATDVPTLDTSKISGLANSATITASASAGNSTIVQRTGSGYVFANYFNTTANDVSSGVTKVMVETGNDGYIRHGTSAAIRTFIGATSSDTASTVVMRNGSGDMFARLFRSDYQNQSDCGAGIAFRNSTSDNYIRFCTNMGNVRSRIFSGSPFYTGSPNSFSNYGLRIYGSEAIHDYTDPQADWFTNGGSIQAEAPITTYSLYVQYGIRAMAIAVFSDMRIKRDFMEIDDTFALEKLRQLKPTSYRYIDKTRVTVGKVLGFIAQEVAEVLPDAVSKTKSVIPNIQTEASIKKIDEEKFELTLKEPHPVTVGTMLEIKSPTVGHLDVEVVSVINDTTFTIFTDYEEIDKIGDRVWVYGEYVDDFHNLDKNAIWTVATAALQEVDRQLQAEKEKVKSLEERLAALEAIVLNQ